VEQKKLEMKNKINIKQIFISSQSLNHNFRIIQKKVEKSQVMGVIKGDAYGHGMKHTFKTLRKAGCNSFYVARLDDALELRGINSKCSINLLGGFTTLENIKTISNHRITPIINNFDQLILLKNHPALKFILHFDTGMNRLGFKVSETPKLLKHINQKNLLAVMSHLTSSDDGDLNGSRRQLNDLIQINTSFNKPMSIANSGGIFLNKKFHLDFVRPGKSLYGINPFVRKSFGLKPVMRIYAPILQIANVAKNQTIGYSKTFKAKKTLKVATIDFGYSDGFLRSGSNQANVYIEKFKCPIVGRVSMDLITIDVSNVPEKYLYIGKPVEILGPHQSYENIALQTGTNEHEILISLGKNAKRVYY
jgi:alanine racemase